MSLVRILMFLIFVRASLQASAKDVEQWSVFEVSFNVESRINPFTEVQLSSIFVHDSLKIKVNGFYDGDNIFRIRFMPPQAGEWSYVTKSNVASLDDRKGKFKCVEPSSINHGYVCVRDTFHFAYKDGTPYLPLGTTAYAWHLQEDSLCKQTLQSLKESPFNKIRMCVFPKKYRWIMNDPAIFPFEKKSNGEWDFERFNPTYFQELDKNIDALAEMGIEVDLILFHPYDYSWGFDEMDSITDIRYLDYIIARLASFRNVWWSMGNEYDLIKSKNDDRWDSYFKFIKANDPYGHLLSVHNGPRWYNHSKPWITHLSLQTKELESLVEVRDKYQKPVLVDECGYEGNLPWEWGNLTAKELVHRFWVGISRGCYVAAHGETFLDDNDVLWWSKGGVLKGESVERIRFIKKISESFPLAKLNPVSKGYWRKRGGCCAGDDFYLYYTGNTQSKYIEVELSDNCLYDVEIIDAWDMVVRKYDEKISGKCRINLPEKPYQVIICRNIKK